MDRDSWHCIGGSDQDHPQEKEMQKGKIQPRDQCMVRHVNMYDQPRE